MARLFTLYSRHRFRKINELQLIEMERRENVVKFQSISLNKANVGLLIIFCAFHNLVLVLETAYLSHTVNR